MMITNTSGGASRSPKSNASIRRLSGIRSNTVRDRWNDTSDKKALEGWAACAGRRVAKYKSKIPLPYMEGLNKAIDDLTYIQAFHDIPHYICS